jgi:PAS domain S-box-containing protein
MVSPADAIADARTGAAPVAPALLLVAGVPPAARDAVAALWQPLPSVVDVTDWSDARLAEIPASSGDLIFVGAAAGSPPELEFVRALRARHPLVPVVAHVPAEPFELQIAMLRGGAHEVVTDLAHLPDAVARARARIAVRDVEVAARPPRPGSADGAHGFDGLFPNLFDWIYVLGIAEDGIMSFETVNPPLNAGIGFLNPDFAGRPAAACLQGTGAALLLPHFEQVLVQGQPLQFEEEHAAGGRARIFQTVLTPVRNKWGRIHRVAGISRDVTALKEALAALKASEERLHHALEGTQQGLWDWDLSTGRLYRSHRWFEMIGAAPDSVDATLDAGLDRIHPEDRGQVEAALNAHLEGRLPRYQAEYRLRSRGDEWIWIFDAGKIVAWDSEGHASRVAGLCTDITERRRAEESLRALVGGVVHEIRNPVYGISINLDALEATFGEEPRYRSFVSALRESAERISSLMNDLRDYGEPRTLNPEPCLVRSLLDGAWRSCESLAAEGFRTVRLDLEDPALVLPLNTRRMHQVFRNLLENALQHAPAGSAVVVSGRRARAAGHDWWTFTVLDDGSGFAGEALARAFEPFFTRRAGGTGLGLSIVKRVVEEHGGTVEAGNRPEGGARVTVRLPAPRLRMELMDGLRA